MAIRIQWQRSAVKAGHVTARVSACGRQSIEDFIHWAEGNSTLSAADLRAAVAALRQFLAARLAEGFVVDLDELGVWSVSVPGAWPEGQWTEIRPVEGRTPVRVNARVKPGLRREVTARAQFEDAGLAGRRPHLLRGLDAASGRSAWAPGGLLTLFGVDIAFDAGDPEQGIFARPSSAAGGAWRRIEAYGPSTAKRISFVAPADMAGAGELEFELRLRYRRDKTSPPGALRTARLSLEEVT